MLDTPTSANLSDFKQRYTGVFGWLCKDTGKLPVYVSNVNSRQVTFTDKDGASYFTAIDSGINFEFAPVMRGWYYTPDGIYFVCRVPARQWRRGICQDNTSVAGPHSVEYQLDEKAWRKAVFDILENKVSKGILHGNEVYSRHFANILGQLYVYSKPIGVVKNKVVHFTKDTSFKQEFMDLCKRDMLDLEIV